MFTQLAFIDLPDYFYLVFGVCALVSLCIVLFFAKRHPNPHFRPRKSEVGIVSFMLLMASAGVSYFGAGLFETDIDPKKLEARAKATAAGMQRNSMEEDYPQGVDPPAPKGDQGNGNIPAEVPDEVRSALSRD